MNKSLQTLIMFLNLGLTVLLILIIWGPMRKLETSGPQIQTSDEQTISITQLRQELKQYDFDRKRQYEELNAKLDSVNSELTDKIANLPTGDQLAMQIKSDTERILAAQSKPIQLPELFRLEDMIKTLQQSLGNLSLPLDGIIKTLATYNKTNADFLQAFEKLNTVLQMQKTVSPIVGSNWLDKLGEYINIGGRVYRLSPATQMEYRFTQITSGIIFSADQSPQYLKKDGKLYKLTDTGPQAAAPAPKAPGGIVPKQPSWLPLPETAEQIDKTQRDLEAITQELEKFRKEIKAEE